MIVADTNLLVYLYLPGQHTVAAERVLSTDAAWAAPLLWRSEFRNVLALFLRKGQMPFESAVKALQAAETLMRGREYAVETTRILDLVRRSSCSAYDCEFVALALDLGVPLVTSDSRMLADFPNVALAPASFGN